MPTIAYISSFFNPADFQKPVKNCERFLSETVGSAFPSEDFYFCQVKSDKCKSVKLFLPQNYIELNSESILWHKERCFNLLVRKYELYKKYDYICWLDTDILFDKPIVLSKDFNFDAFQPFKFSLRQSDAEGKSSFKLNSWAFINDPNSDIGLGWAIKSKLLRTIGGFFDYGIMGSGDTIFAKRMIGKQMQLGCPILDKEISNYFKDLYIYPQSITYLDNVVTHLYHGNLKNRHYGDRMNILRKHNFNPLDDLIVEKSGLYRLINKDFESEVKRFFINREEDT